MTALVWVLVALVVVAAVLVLWRSRRGGAHRGRFPYGRGRGRR